MATFQGKTGLAWTFELNAPIVQEIQKLHQITLTNLDTDPLLKMRNDPLTLAAVIFLLCQDSIRDQNLTPDEFAKQLPNPPDSMLEAVADAIVNFSPTERHSHVREALAIHGEMAAKADAMISAKARETINDPATMERLKTQSDNEIKQAINDLFPLASDPIK